MQTSAGLMLSVILLSTTWETLVGALPYGVRYSVVALVACFVALVLDEEVNGKSTSIRSVIRRMFLSATFSWGLTWLGTVKGGFSYETNFIVSACTGLCIQFVAPWVQIKGFGYIQKLFKFLK